MRSWGGGKIFALGLSPPASSADFFGRPPWYGQGNNRVFARFGCGSDRLQAWFRSEGNRSSARSLQVLTGFEKGPVGCSTWLLPTIVVGQNNRQAVIAPPDAVLGDATDESGVYDARLVGRLGIGVLAWRVEILPAAKRTQGARRPRDSASKFIYLQSRSR